MKKMTNAIMLAETLLLVASCSAPGVCDDAQDRLTLPVLM